MSLSPGTLLGPYEVLAPLGAGGMGEVYRARDPRLGRDVALKILREEAVSGGEARKRFEREARAVAALSHPNILAIHDVGSENAQLYIVMELLEGETLRERLARGALPWRKAAEIAAATADGLAAAHGKGIVHRDLKPANVFLIPDGHVKILDFGLARIREPHEGVDPASPTRSQTDPGRVVGTVGYMSPEQVAASPVDTRSDIFSLGCVLYEMVSGERPFARPTAAETMAAILNDEPLELEEIPPELRRLIAHCLEKQPDARLHSAHDLAFDLRALLDSSASKRPSAEAAVPRRRRPMAWVLAAGLAGAAVLTVLSVRRPRDAPPPLVQTHLLPPEGTIFARPHAVPRTTGLTGHLAVSPDGRSIAFVAQPREDEASLWVRSLGEVSPRRLEGTEGASDPFWSPDSRFLGFFADAQVKSVAAVGGPPQVICAKPPGFHRHGAWSPQGVIVFGILGDPLYRVPASGGRPEPVTELDASRADRGHADPLFLPDGRRFLFQSSSATTPELSGLHAASLDSDKATLVATLPDWNTVDVRRVEIDVAARRLLFLRGTTLVALPFDFERLRVTGEATPIAHDVAAFSASEDGVLAYARVAPRQLVWLDRTGRELETIGDLGGRFFRLSHDGRRLAGVEDDPQTGTSDVWVYDLTRRVGTRLTSDPGRDSLPVWSPDDEWIAFGSNRGGRFGLYQIPSTGAGSAELLFTPDIRMDAESWSTDGRHLILTGGGEVGHDLWVLSLADRSAVRLFRTPFKEFHGLLSPDARWIAYISAIETERREIYVQSFPASAARWRISTGGGLWPRWRGDGKELFYVTTGRPKMMAVEVKATDSFQAGPPRVLFDVPATSTLEGWFAVSADGQRFLFKTVVPEEGTTPIVLVQNWRALLEE